MVQKKANPNKSVPKKKFSLFLLINLIVLLAFTIYFLSISNYEFLLYAFTLLVFILFIYITANLFNYSNMAKSGFTFWLFLHLAGGAFKINGTRLYDLVLINLLGDPFYILRYDQLLHAISFFVMTLLIYSIVKSISPKDSNKLVIGLLAFLGGMGLGAINEVIEFITVIFFDAGAAVGDYYNTALDLVFNAIGALIAVFVANKSGKNHNI